MTLHQQKAIGCWTKNDEDADAIATMMIKTRARTKITTTMIKTTTTPAWIKTMETLAVVIWTARTRTNGIELGRMTMTIAEKTMTTVTQVCRTKQVDQPMKKTQEIQEADPC